MERIHVIDGRKRNTAKRFSVTNLFIALLLMCCSALLVRSAPASQLEKILAAGELRVLSRNGPISYYQGQDGLTGFEYTLLKGFADELGIRLVLENDDSLNQLAPSARPRFDMASPSVINSSEFKERFRYTTPFVDLHLEVVFNSLQPAPSSIKDLSGKRVLLVNKTSVPMPLAELQASQPDIKWELVDNLEMTDLLEMVERGTADYVLVDSAIFDIHRYSYPHAQVAFNVDAPLPLAWAFAPSRDNSLFDAAQAYLAKIHTNGQLAKISSTFFDQFIEVTTDDALMFSERFETRFPRWESDIKAAAAQYNLDWRLLAAVGYQESHWIPNAQSPTGVRGFMMLTPDTAKELGVKNLEDPKQSILGGAKYLRYLLDNLPDAIQGEDRMLMALASYNQGMGHLADARSLTRKLKGDANNWQDVSKAFPLLAKEEFYSKATFGYSRGWEPVIYVRNVINFHRILQFKESQEQLRMATSYNSDDLEFNATKQEKGALEKLNQIRLSNASSLSLL